MLTQFTDLYTHHISVNILNSEEKGHHLAVDFANALSWMVSIVLWLKFIYRDFSNGFAPSKRQANTWAKVDNHSTMWSH